MYCLPSVSSGRTSRARIVCGGTALLLAFGAQTWSSAQSSPTDVVLVDPEQLVSEAVDNELHPQSYDGSRWCYRKLVQADVLSEIREVCQTASGDIDRLLAVNQRALSPKLQRKEDERIQNLVTNSSELRKEQERRSGDATKARQILRSVPGAFQYQYVGRQGDVVQLKFIPNPSFDPRSRPEEIFRHIKGNIWIDCKHKRLLRIEGQVVSEVKFAAGLLGRLQSGGTFLFRQAEVGPGQWMMITLNIHMQGKALLFKTIAVQEDREFSDYRRIDADTTPAQAAELLQEGAATLYEDRERIELLLRLGREPRLQRQ
jgi:hypothetical protein